MRLPEFHEVVPQPVTLPAGRRYRPPSLPPAPPGAPGSPSAGPPPPVPFDVFPPDLWLPQFRLVWFALEARRMSADGPDQHETLDQAEALLTDCVSGSRALLVQQFTVLRQLPGGRKMWPRLDLPAFQEAVLHAATEGVPALMAQMAVDGLLHQVHPAAPSPFPDWTPFRYPLLPKHGPIRLSNLLPEAFLERVLADLLDSVRLDQNFSSPAAYRNSVLAKCAILRKITSSLATRDKNWIRKDRS